MQAGAAGMVARVEALERLRREVAARQPGNLAGGGYKVYSQSEEDGIIAAIFEQVGGGRTFLEIGVEDGTECNTHLLALQGWRGQWIEADPAHCGRIREGLGGDSFAGRFRLVEARVRADNAEALYREACGFLGVEQVDFLSIDIDGNDYFVLGALLASGVRPGVICTEYNGRFSPPMRICVTHDDAREWALDDYFGASLQRFHDLLEPHGYRLVTCNLVGVNAFFVRQDKAAGLQTFAPGEVWQPLRLYLSPLPSAHAPSLKFLRDALSEAIAPGGA